MDARRVNRGFGVALVAVVAGAVLGFVPAGAAVADALTGVPFTAGGATYRVAATGQAEALQVRSGSSWSAAAALPAHPGDFVFFGGTLFVEAGYSSAAPATAGSLYELSSGSFVPVAGAPSDVRGEFVSAGALIVRTATGWSKSTDGVAFAPVAGAPAASEWPVVAGGDVFFSTAAHGSTAAGWWRYDGSTFTELSTPPSEFESPAVADGVIYLRTGASGVLTSYDGTGFVALPGTPTINAGPVALQGSIYVGQASGTHERLERVTGSGLVHVASGITRFARLTVTGSTLYYSGASGSTWGTYRVPVTAGTDSVTGARVVGSTLTTVATGWQAGATLHYQWARAGRAISHATASTYPLTPADLGKSMQVTVTGSAPGYVSTSVITRTKTVQAASLTATPVPTVTGTYSIGSTLTAAAGTWGPSPVTLHYQWRRGGKAVPGATKSTYRLVAADGAQAVGVTVTGSRAGYRSVSKSSAATLVPGKLTPTPTPRVTGTLRVGSRLTAVTGVWGPGQVSLHFVWQRNGVAIPGATHPTYTLVSADLDARITLAVTGSRTHYVSVTKTHRTSVIRHAVDARYSTCAAAEAAGAHTPYVRGQDPEYAWYDDRDGDGVVCE